eukprot:15334617-Ditylum_brightwellii.AAC.1
MCWLLKGGEDLLPDHSHLCTEKGKTEDMNDCIITDKLQNNKVYTKVDIPVTQQFLKMIRQRKWAGGHPIPTAATAATVDAFVEATQTTAAKIKSTKLKATMPADTNEWMNNLKGYTNLVHGLSGPICPHFFQMREVITNLQGLKAEACNNISPEAKAESLTAKDTCICHAELPTSLIPATQKRKWNEETISSTPSKKPTT